MSVTRLPGGGYKVRWRTPDGRHPSRTFKHGDGKGRTARQVAQDFYDEVRYAKKAGHLRTIEAPTVTLGQVAAEWARESQVSPKTRKLYEWLYHAHIEPEFSDQIMGQITVRDIERWFAAMKTGPVAKRKAGALLNQLFRAGMRWEYCTSNPVEVAKRPKAPAKRATRPPSPRECEQIMRAMPTIGDSTLVSTLYQAGLRPQEALRLRWDDVRDRTLLVDAPKTGRSRAVKLFPTLASDLRKWKVACPPQELVFPSKRGKPISETGWHNWRNRIWKEAAPAGMRPYDLRHTFVSLLIREGLSVVEIAAQAGHSPEVCLRTYAHEFAELQGLGNAEETILAAREDSEQKARATG